MGGGFNVISYHPVKFGVHKACGIGDKTFLIRNVTTHGHVIKEPRYFAITLLSLVSIGIVEVKI